jgi:hypothetical protein
MMVIDEDAAMFSGHGDGSSDEFSQQRWQDKTAAVADDYFKLKFQLETAMRDKERDANTISSLKHVRKNNFHQITFVVFRYSFLPFYDDVISRRLAVYKAEWQLLL